MRSGIEKVGKCVIGHKNSFEMHSGGLVKPVTDHMWSYPSSKEGNHLIYFNDYGFYMDGEKMNCFGTYNIEYLPQFDEFLFIGTWDI